MDIIIEEKSNCVILKLNGNLIEGPSSAEFNNIIKRYIEVNQKNIVVDFGDIKFINSTGLSILFRGYLAIENVGGKFKIVNLNSKLKNLLSITKLNTLFDIEENIETAIKSLG
jgi:anti-sigma B factor antagonist